jgi:acetyl-CoA acyltransferase
MIEAVIVDAVRTPMGRGKPGGALSEIHSVDLLAAAIRGIVARTGIDPGSVEDVIVGCVSQASEQSGTPGRQAWLSAGYPVHVPSVTIERKCGSGQQAIDFAIQGVRAGAYDLVIAGGLESMSRVPMGSARGEGDPHGPGVRSRFPTLVSQGVAAELVAEKWALSRDDLDQYAVRSHQLAAQAADTGGFDDEIVSVTTPTGVTVTKDESIRRGTTAEKLAALAPAFPSDENRRQFPDLDWKVTAGNSSQITDGAAVVLIASEDRAEELGLSPRARVVASAVVGDDPLLMLTGPIPASRKVLDRAGLAIAQIDAIEINEAFASVPLAWAAEFDVDAARLNPRGGAIALGHPLGASGVRLMATLINHLEQTGGRYGLQSMCEAGGMANAMVIELLQEG